MIEGMPDLDRMYQNSRGKVDKNSQAKMVCGGCNLVGVGRTRMSLLVFYHEFFINKRLN